MTAPRRTLALAALLGAMVVFAAAVLVVAFWSWATSPIAAPSMAPAATVQPVPLSPDSTRPLVAPSLLRTVRPLHLAHEAETTDLPISPAIRESLRRIR